MPYDVTVSWLMIVS